MRNTVKYVLAISSAAVLTAGAFLLSAKPAGANTICTNSVCEGSGFCIGPLGGNTCFSNEAGCASTKCPP